MRDNPFSIEELSRTQKVRSDIVTSYPSDITEYNSEPTQLDIVAQFAGSIHKWMSKANMPYDQRNEDKGVWYAEDYVEHKEALDISKAAKNINVPHLLIHGNQDTSVDIAAAHQLKRCNPKATTYFLDTNHVFGSKHPWESAEMPLELSLVTEKIIAFL